MDIQILLQGDTTVKLKTGLLVRRAVTLLFMTVIVAAFTFNIKAATLSANLNNKLAGVADGVEVGMVIVAFNTTNGLQDSHLNVLRSVGVTGGQTFPTLGMVAQPMTAGQVRALINNAAVRSLWSNDRLYY